MQTFMHVKTVAELEQNFDDAETQVQVSFFWNMTQLSYWLFLCSTCSSIMVF